MVLERTQGTESSSHDTTAGQLAQLKYAGFAGSKLMGAWRVWLLRLRTRRSAKEADGLQAMDYCSFPGNEWCQPSGEAIES